MKTGISKGHCLNEEVQPSMESKTKFNDVTAAVEAKAEVEEVVHYLRDPKRFIHLRGNEEVQLRCFASGAFLERFPNLVDKPNEGGLIHVNFWCINSDWMHGLHHLKVGHVFCDQGSWTCSVPK